MNAAVVLLICNAWLMAAVDAQNQYTSLYNTRVVSARRMERPLGSSGGSLGYGLPHAGVVVTLEDGSTWLVHKGNDYSQGSSGCQAVVTDDRYMSSAWHEVERATCSQRHRLGSYVQEAGCQYNLFFDNCWDAARRMMSLCRRSSGSWWGR